MQVTVNEIKVLKDQLAQNIMQQIRDFEETTGVTVHMDIEYIHQLDIYGYRISHLGLSVRID